MPTFDYVCRKCGKQEQRSVPIAERDSQICCFEPMKRTLAAPAIQFKGSGFYITDYKKQGR